MILRENSSEIMNVLGEAIAEIALRPDRYEKALQIARAEGIANLDLLDTFIDAEPALSWTRPDAGLIGLARLAPGLDGDTIGARLLAPPYKTFLVPGSAYGLPQHIRVGVGGGPDVKLDEGLRRLSTCLRDMMDR
jgi:aspartate/methionine/tyrosine aminotransferase